MDQTLRYIGAAAIIIFVLMGILTVVALIADDSEGSEEEQTEVKTLPTVEKKDTAHVVVSQPLETDPYEELNSLIGLDDVKKEVEALSNYVKVQKARKEKGLKTRHLSYHLVFTGNPDTGKTTVARIVARIYKDLGILKKGHLVETDRAGLVAGYVGQTAIKTNQLVDSALNGVLFVDEAYSLVPNNRSEDYGQEAIATLLKRMEDDRDSLVVIIAGYTDEMKKFIDSNPGLKSRFTRYIHFPDYSADELMSIFELYMKKDEYQLTTEAKGYVLEAFRKIIAQNDRNFGNARYARNKFERAIQIQANRLSKIRKPTKDELSTLTLEDVQKAFGL